MPNNFRGFLAAAALVALSASNQAQAALLSLSFSGLTGAGSTWVGTSPIDNGTAFTIKAMIKDQFFRQGSGYADYEVTSLSVDVGATHYVAMDSYLTEYYARLSGPPQNALGSYMAALFFNEPDPYTLEPHYTAFGAFYGATTPKLNVYAPSATVFSGFSDAGNAQSQLRMFPSNIWGVLDLVTITPNRTSTVNTRIEGSAVVPLPATLWLFISGLVGIGAAGKKRFARKPA